jgi:uncharacterized protein YndB with AHSA1/START domain
VKVESEIEIDAPRERVFELLLDPHRLGEWVTPHRGVEGAPPGKLRKGSEFRQTLSIAGSRFGVRWRVVELQRPSLAIWHGLGPAGSRAEVRYELREDGDGTVFRYRNDYHLPGGPLGIAAGRVTAGPARHAMTSTLGKLKRVLEAEG